jgi:hypothetical protein
MFTRNQSSAEHIAVNALLALRRSNYAITAEVSPSLTIVKTTPASSGSPSTHFTRSGRSIGVVSNAPTQNLVSSSKISSRRFWTQWTNWYHTFLSEATDEFPSLPIAERRSEATTRWVTFTAKQLSCSESTVRAWLRTANQKALVAAYS